MNELEEKEEIVRPALGSPRFKMASAIIDMQKSLPFFSYLSMNLNMKEVKEEIVNTAAVDAQGNLYYSGSFVLALNPEQRKTLIAHEVLHCALLHNSSGRIMGRDHEMWNVAIDIVVNNILELNHFTFGGLLDKGFVPHENRITVGKTEIKELDKKTAEDIYDILENEIKLGNIEYVPSPDGKGNMWTDSQGRRQGFDKHMPSKDASSQTAEERDKIERAEEEWKNKLCEAGIYSKNQGNEPRGMTRLIGDLLNSKMNWREILNRFITQEIPFDFTYSYPSKKSIATGFYMPSIVKDHLLEVTIAIDTSGSIGKDELTEFLTEVYSISRSYERVKMNLLFWDAEIQGHYKLDDCNIDELLENGIKGGGGTDFTGVYDYIKKNIIDNKVLVFLTDGYATFPASEECKTLWVLSKQSAPSEEIPFGEVIKLD